MQQMVSVKKGMRVEFNTKTGKKLGVILKVTGGRATVQADGEGCFSGDARLFRVSNQPLPKELANPFMKGMRVEWDDKGTTYYGTVTSVNGLSISVAQDGGQFRVKGQWKGFRASSKPVATDTIKTPLDIYSVISYRGIAITDEFIGHEGGGYRCKIAKNGKPIFAAENEGVGGCGNLYTLNGVSQKEVTEFENAVKQWYVLLGGQERDVDGELYEQWIEWYVHGKKYGQTAESVVKDWNKFRDDLREKYPDRK